MSAAARSRRSAQWSVDPSRNYLPGTCSLSAARRSGGARWSHPARLGTLTRVRRTHAPRDRLVRSDSRGSGAGAVVLTAESARLADGAVRLASAPDRRCRFAIAGSPPPGSSTSRAAEGTSPAPSRPPGPGAEPGDRHHGAGRRRDARTRRGVLYTSAPPSDLVHSTVRRNCQTRVTRTAILYTGVRGAGTIGSQPPQFAIAV